MTKSIRGALHVWLLGMAGVPLTAQLTFERIVVPILPPGSPAIWMAAADFHRDGRADLVTVNVNGTATVLIGRGDGGFDAPRVIVSAPLPVREVFTADINGDGLPDVVATHPMAHMISVVFAREGGGFATAETYPCGTSPNSVAAGDFNGDGTMDLAVANIAGLLPSQPGTTVTILQGAGNGRFRPPYAVTVSTPRPMHLAAADVNHDGRADLFVSFANAPGALELLLGNANGTMSASPERITVPFGIPMGIGIEDVNGDGRADLVAAVPPRLWWWRGRGDGRFTEAASIDFEATTFVMADVNGDGVKDAVGANGPFSVAIVALNLGEAGFGVQQAFVVGPQPNDVAAADFTGDGVVDVITTDQGAANFSLLRNTTPRPTLSANGVVNAASFQTGPAAVAPGEIVTIFGRNLGPAQLVTARLEPPGYLATELGTTRVFFNGTPAPLIYARNDQVSAVVPYGLPVGQTIALQVAYGSMYSAAASLRAVAAHPGVFTLSASGAGAAAVINQDGSVNSASNPARRGSIVAFFATGEGLTNPAGQDGRISSPPLAAPVLAVTVGMANQGAEILYAGAAPGIVAGLMQINARVPLDVPAGPRVPLIIKVGEVFSQPGVTIAIE
ncbi:MAG: FG-GAP-like repeat-containing protein [Bryobacteraceae bacterium]|nr:FG-GAP-like repeat-containing protein [Bryobacteraceae bacterium]